MSGKAMPPSVAVLDYGSGNLRSAERALGRAGADLSVTDDRDLAGRADGLGVPGGGASAACMAGIEALGAGKVIAARVADGRPVLGICVGMQILFAAGEEHGVSTPGLGLLPGTVRRLDAVRVPHMGWNTVTPAPGSLLFDGTAPSDRFYFVHSYAARPIDVSAVTEGARVTVSVHDAPFVAAVESHDGVLACTQFHPEKSGDTGARLLRTWVAYVARHQNPIG